MRLLSQQYNRKTRRVMLVMSITTASSFKFLSPSIVGALSESDEMNFIPSMCVTLQGKEKSSCMSITSHPFPEQSRGVQTQIMFVKYVALHFDLSLSASRRIARIVMDSGEGMWYKRVVTDWDGHGSKMKEK